MNGDWLTRDQTDAASDQRIKTSIGPAERSPLLTRFPSRPWGVPRARPDNKVHLIASSSSLPILLIVSGT
jgi:hypothetical protein